MQLTIWDHVIVTSLQLRVHYCGRKTGEIHGIRKNNDAFLCLWMSESELQKMVFSFVYILGFSTWYTKMSNHGHFGHLVGYLTHSLYEYEYGTGNFNPLQLA